MSKTQEQNLQPNLGSEKSSQLNTQKDKLLEGRVATILNARELAINIGIDRGVREGMIFKVLAESPIEIKDPITKEIIGYVDPEKVQVKVVKLQDKFSICKTFRTFSTGGNLYEFVSPLGQLKKYLEPPKTVAETLKVEDSSLPAPLPEKESYVKIGDRVIQVIES